MIDLQLFADEVTPASTPAPTVPTIAPTTVQQTSSGTIVSTEIGTETTGDMGSTVQAPIEGAVIVPAGTPNSVSFKGTDGKEYGLVMEGSEAAKQYQAQQVKPTTTPAPQTGQQQTEPPAQQQQQQQQGEQQKPADYVAQSQQLQQSVQQDLQTKGVNFDDLAKEYTDNGELSEASLKSLHDAGYPQPMIDAYINSMNATADKFVQDVYTAVGGEDAWNSVIEFAKTQDKAVIDGFNAVINTGNIEAIKATFAGVQAQMANVRGTANPSILGGNTMSANSITPFSSMDEMADAMANPKYQHDTAYTNEVLARVRVSKL